MHYNIGNINNSYASYSKKCSGEKKINCVIFTIIMTKSTLKNYFSKEYLLSQDNLSLESFWIYFKKQENAYVLKHQ